MAKARDDDDDFGTGGDGRRLKKNDNHKGRVSPDSVAQDQLKAFVERIERLAEEKAAIQEDIKEVYAEAKGNGFDTKTLRKLVAIRKQDHNERLEQEALLELYMSALGMASAPPDDDFDD